jgi:hypothetical protein
MTDDDMILQTHIISPKKKRALESEWTVEAQAGSMDTLSKEQLELLYCVTTTLFLID